MNSVNSMNSSVLGTPAGPLTILVGADGAVRAAGFTGDVDAVLARVHPSLAGPVRPRPDLGPVTRAVLSYLDGDLAAIDEVPVAQHGTGMQLAGWAALRTIAPGRPLTYTEFATLLGSPSAVRAAASICARNAPALFVPCHRVLRTDGTLGGFAWGLPVKQRLLDREAGVPALV